MSRLIRFHDGERYLAGIELEPGRKLRHIVALYDGGVRVVSLPLEQPVQVLGEVKPRHVTMYRRAAKNFGASAAALVSLKELAA